MKNINKLGLGTVQWGLSYGLANQHGVTSPQTVNAILAEAQRLGIKVLDTASLYGEAEAVLGSSQLQAFKVVTKTPRFTTNVITDEQAQQLTQAFYQSLKKLATKKVFGLLLHHAGDLLAPGGNKLLNAMRALKQKGEVEKIGVSVYDSEQVDAVLQVFKPDLIQLPVSVLDQRMLISGQLERLKAGGVEIHARSVFLQGLLLMPMSQVPQFFEPLQPLLSSWHTAAKNQGMTPSQAALSFVRDIPHIDTVLIGVENLLQFQSCFADFSVKASFDASGLACNDPVYVNPALWRVG